MPELERLGLCDYIEAIKRRGFKVAWPDLQLRGLATPMQNLFYKDWSAILTSILPNAAAESKYLHSWRKGGNSQMAAKNINDPFRHQMLGHSYRDINGRHYTEELSLEDKRVALGIANVTTAHLQRRPLSLHPGL